MTPEAARDRNLGVKMQTMRVIMYPGIPQSSKNGVMNDPKSCQKSKLEVIFAQCAPMTPCPPLAQPLAKTVFFSFLFFQGFYQISVYVQTSKTNNKSKGLYFFCTFQFYWPQSFNKCVFHYCFAATFKLLQLTVSKCNGVMQA